MYINRDDVTFTVTTVPEEDMPEDYFTDGDRVVQILRDSVVNQNPWAWCVATVTAELDGLSGSQSLGACNYKSEEDFIQGDYFRDLCDTAFKELTAEVEEKYGDVVRKHEAEGCEVAYDKGVLVVERPNTLKFWAFTEEFFLYLEDFQEKRGAAIKALTANGRRVEIEVKVLSIKEVEVNA